MSLTKVHLVDSDVPLKENVNRTAICGKSIPNAVFAFMFDGDRMPDGDATFSVCCVACAKTRGKRYLYGIIPGEESLHDGDAA